MHDGSVLDLPPVLFGTLGNDAGKKTIMLYGHLDVQPALMVSKLNSEKSDIINIFNNTIEKLIGRRLGYRTVCFDGS